MPSTRVADAAGPGGRTMSRLLHDGKFFLPGPTEVRPEILAALAGPMISHRGAAFERLFAALQAGLRPAFRTTRPVLISSSSATGMMEAGIRSAPTGPILALVNGAFAARFVTVARACGREVVELEAQWGRVVPLEAVEARLRGRRFAAVTVVHSETSTGALTDIRAVQELARRYGAVCMVDSVSGIAGIPVETDLWGLDYVFSGSQKAFALPPGLAFAVASDPFLAAAAKVPGRGRYFDLVEFDAFARRSQTPNTPALPLLYALEAQLAAMAVEGIEARWARHEAMRERVSRWVGAAAAAGVPVGILAAEGERSATVTAITLPAGVSASTVVAGLEQRGYVVGGGYGKLRDATVRIGHMGDHTVTGLERCLAELGGILGVR
ncbi:MAG TPA: aminotransferase class V-fold PLP-dependent enzyme [Gemmatimonadales bacterium]|nr:aminotransferase class V-fold PLP-dependent enzyme [Gemmatimonadales bacterium]